MSVDIVKKIEKIADPSLKDILLYIIEQIETIREEMLTKKEFRDFVRNNDENFKKVWKAIKELSEAQKRTEKRLDKLNQRVDGLNQRVDGLTQRVDGLNQRVDGLTQRVDGLTQRVDGLTQRVDGLTEAQKRIEKRLDQLTERVDGLTEAQKRIEKRLEGVIRKQEVMWKEQKAMRKEIGGLAHSIGYFLEDRAYRGLPGILKERFDIEVTQPLRRIHVETGRNRYAEINVFGKGIREGKELYIIGECKVRLTRKDVNKFLKTLEKVGDRWEGEKFIIIVAYHVTPSIEQYVKDKGLNLIHSFELPV